MNRPAAPAYGPMVPPGAWRGAGVVLLVALAGTHLAALRDWDVRAAYLDAGLLAVSLAAAAAAGAVALRANRRDWQRAVAVAVAAAAAYLVSRGVGWPGASAEVGHWSSPDGSAALAVDLLTLVVAAGALRWAAPGRRTRQPGRAGPVPAISTRTRR